MFVIHPDVNYYTPILGVLIIIIGSLAGILACHKAGRLPREVPVTLVSSFTMGSQLQEQLRFCT
jgi:hypothetical protein